MHPSSLIRWFRAAKWAAILRQAVRCDARSGAREWLGARRWRGGPSGSRAETATPTRWRPAEPRRHLPTAPNPRTDQGRCQKDRPRETPRSARSAGIEELPVAVVVTELLTQRRVQRPPSLDVVCGRVGLPFRRRLRKLKRGLHQRRKQRLQAAQQRRRRVARAVVEDGAELRRNLAKALHGRGVGDPQAQGVRRGEYSLVWGAHRTRAFAAYVSGVQALCADARVRYRRINPARA